MNADMINRAWVTREVSKEQTKVGAAVLTSGGYIFAGCNIQHRHRSHDIHAEISAISSMVSSGHRDLVAIIIVADRAMFTPCGACLDWIFEFGGPECEVGFMNNTLELFYTAKQLMPFYPR